MTSDTLEQQKSTHIRGSKPSTARLAETDQMLSRSRNHSRNHKGKPPASERPTERPMERPLVGREKQLNQLNQQFELTRKQAFCISYLSGKIGSGRTALAKQYIATHSSAQTIAVNVVIDDQHNQTHQFIQSLLTAAIDQLSTMNSLASSALLGQIWTILHREDVDWLFKHLIPSSLDRKHGDFQRTNLATEHKIIRRDAFLAIFKRLIIECCRTISSTGFTILCHCQNLEKLDFDGLDFLTDAFRNQSLPCFHLLFHTDTQDASTVDYFIKDLHSYSSESFYHRRFLSISLPALTKKETHQLIAAELTPNSINLSLLSQIIFDHSRGNPSETLYIIERLKELHLLYQSQTSGLWDAHLEKIRRLNLMEGDYDRTHEIIERSYITKKILIYAACFQHPFTTAILKAITPKELWPQIEPTLELCLNYELITPHHDLPEHFIFHSFKTVESILSVENSHSLNVIYQKIFSVLIAHYPQSEVFTLPITFFQLADCLNSLMPIAVRYNALTTYQSICINTFAGYEAYQRNDIYLAYRYFKVATKLIDSRHWHEHHSLCFFSLHHWLTCLYLREEYDACLQKIERFEDHALTDVERAKLTLIQIDCLKAIGQYGKAIEHSIQSLQQLGIDTPKKVTPLQVIKEYIIAKRLFNKTAHRYFQAQAYQRNTQRSCSSIAHTVKDNQLTRPTEKTVLIHKIVEVAAQSGYFTDVFYTHYFSLKLIALSEKYGYTNYSQLGFEFVGLIDFLFFKRYDNLDTAYQNNTRSDSEPGNNKLVSEMFYWGMQGPWRFSLQDCNQQMLKAYLSLRFSGDAEAAGHCSTFFFSFGLLHGNNFKTLLKQFHTIMPELEAPKFSSAYHCNLMLAQVTENAVYPDRDPTELRGKWFDDVKYDAFIQKSDFIGKFCYHSILSYIHLMYNNWQQGLHFYQTGIPYTKGIFGVFSVTIFRFVGEMSLLTKMHLAPSWLDRFKYTPRLLIALFYFSKLAKTHPQNFSCFYHLLNGFTQSALRLSQKKALKEINRGISAAKAGGYLNLMAHSYELKYKFIFAKREKKSILALRTAVDIYQKIHNNAKADDLRKLIKNIKTSGNSDSPIT